MDGNAKAIFQAIRKNDFATVTREIGQNPALVNATDEENLTPLHVAAIEDRTDIVRWLIDNGANTEAVDAHHGSTPLGWAAYYAKPNVIRVLLEAGVDSQRRNAYGKTPYQVAEMGAAGDWQKYTGIEPDAYKPVMDVLSAHGAADTKKGPS